MHTQTQIGYLQSVTGQIHHLETWEMKESSWPFLSGLYLWVTK